MKQAFCQFIYTTLLGWKSEVNVPDFDKCIIAQLLTPQTGTCLSVSFSLAPSEENLVF